ncbi:MAG: nucleotidyltransferase family protein [bacterium]
MNGRETLQFSKAQIQDFSQKWEVAELHLFGSVLREDFGPESDVDVLVTFLPDAPWSLLDLVRMEEELSRLFGRKVDLVERPAVERSENYIRRKRILSSLEPLYVAG